MSIEVMVAIIGASAALFGAMVGGAVSILTGKAQLRSARQQIQIDHLKRIESSLESLLREWVSLKVDVSGPMDSNQILSRFTDRFLSRVQLFMTASHYFPKSLEENLEALSNEVNRYIYEAKTGGSIDNDAAQEAVRRMQELDTEVPRQIRENLRQLQSEIASLLQAK